MARTKDHIVEKERELPAAPAAADNGAHAQLKAQEKVLSEIVHELGNFFHKLYYWADFLKQRPSRKQASDSTAAEMLERTIKNLEDFLKVSILYFQPTQLSLMRMKAGEVADGLLAQLRSQLNGTPLTVSGGGEWQVTPVMIDPGHLSRAFEVAVRHLVMQIGPTSALGVAVAQGVRDGRPGLEVGFRLSDPNEAQPLFQTSEAGVQWAVAQKVVALHGGELTEQSNAPSEKSVVLFLPLCT
jgi:signal transduction histidine kinase